MITLIAPQPVAEQLVAKGVARFRNPPRSDFFELVTSGVQVSAACVSLLQVPMVYEYYAEAVKQFVRGRSETVSFEMRGPRGKVVLFDVQGDDDIAGLAKRLRDALE